MGIVLSHTTAARFWLGETASRAPLPYAIERVPWEGASGIPWDDLPDACRAPGPLHVIVPDKDHARRSEGVVPHVFNGPVPPGCFVDLGGGLAVVSPELCFIQMAEQMDFNESVMFGMRLCGCYTPVESGLSYHAPFASRDSILRAIEAVGRRPGVGRARTAARYVRDGSASPRESTLGMLLGTGRFHGSFNIELGLLNHRVELDEQTRRLIGKHHLVCDLYWPDEKVAVEYDSDEYHLEAGKIERDAIRRNALQHMGIKVVTVGRMQLNSASLFDSVAREVAQALGKRIREPFSPPIDKVNELRSYLFGDNLWPSVY